MEGFATYLQLKQLKSQGPFFLWFLMKCFDFEGVSKIEQGLQHLQKAAHKALMSIISGGTSIHPSLAWKASDPASQIRYLKVRKTERSCLCRSSGASEM